MRCDDALLYVCIVLFNSRNGTVVTEDDYLASLNSSNSWLAWSTKPLRSVASAVWKITPLGSFTQKQITKTTRLLYLPQLKVTQRKIAVAKR